MQCHCWPVPVPVEFALARGRRRRFGTGAGPCLPMLGAACPWPGQQHVCRPAYKHRDDAQDKSSPDARRGCDTAPSARARGQSSPRHPRQHVETRFVMDGRGRVHGRPPQHIQATLRVLAVVLCATMSRASDDEGHMCWSASFFTRTSPRAGEGGRPVLEAAR